MAGPVTVRAMADGAAMERAATAVEAVRAGGSTFLLGAAGSGTIVQRWAGELVLPFHRDRLGLTAFRLTTNTSMPRPAWDGYGYDRSFARWVEAVGTPGDATAAASISDRHPNAVAVVRAGRGGDVRAAGSTGRFGGDLRKAPDSVLLQVLPGSKPRIQKGHEVLGRIARSTAGAAMFPSP